MVRRWASLSCFDLGQDTSTYSRLEGGLHDQINLGLEPAFEIFTQVQKVEEVDITVERDDYIDVAPLFQLFPDIGAKQAEPPDPVMGFHLRLAVSDDFDYFFLSHNCLPATLDVDKG
jgi:hypothetical protein